MMAGENTVPAQQAEKFAGAFEILKKSFSLYRERFLTLFIIMLIPVAVPLAFKFFPLEALISKSFFFGFFSIGLAIIASILANSIATPAVLFAIKDKIGAKEALKKGLKKIISFWWISFLLTLIVAGGYGLFIVPGILFSVWFSLAIYVLIFEDIGGMEALFRSRQLVSGYFGRTLWRFLILGGFIFLFNFLIGLLGLLIIKTAGAKSAADFINNIKLLLPVFTVPISLIYGATLFDNLRNIKANVAFQKSGAGRKIKFIVAGVIGIVIITGAMVALPTFLIIKGRSSLINNKRQADISYIRTALAIYYDDNKVYPAFLDDPSLAENVSTSFISGLKDPKTGLPYQYISSADSFCVWATLEKGGYFAGSEKGVKKLDSPPTGLPCWEETEKLFY